MPDRIAPTFSTLPEISGLHVTDLALAIGRVTIIVEHALKWVPDFNPAPFLWSLSAEAPPAQLVFRLSGNSPSVAFTGWRSDGGLARTAPQGRFEGLAISLGNQA